MKDPIAEYMRAHPDRVHQVPGRPEPKPKAPAAQPSKKRAAVDATVAAAEATRIARAQCSNDTWWCCGPEVRTATGRLLQEAGCGQLEAGMSGAAVERHMKAHGGGVLAVRTP